MCGTTLHCAVNTRVVAELFGQLIPLAAGTSAMDQAVDCLAGIDARATGLLGRVVDAQELFQQCP
jgi:hypothetical protein